MMTRGAAILIKARGAGNLGTSVPYMEHTNNLTEEMRGVSQEPPANEARPPVVEARHMQRRFGAVVALADASITLLRREVLGLVGDNGAGKSTLLKILSGVLLADSGEIRLEGKPIHIRRAQDAMAAGIETVYQDLALVDTMSAYQNVYLGRE